jgi:hypothetical protein
VVSTTSISLLVLSVQRIMGIIMRGDSELVKMEQLEQIQLVKVAINQLFQHK